MTKLDLIRSYAPRIAEAVSPEQALTMYAPGFRPQDRFALCIAHQEDTPSMRVGPKYVHCFGCGFFGDSIEIVKRLFRLNALQSMTKLNDDFALGFPLGRKLTLRESMEIKARADEISKARRDLKEERLAQFERKLDLEQELFFLEDLLQDFPDLLLPTDPNAPFHPMLIHATHRMEVIKYRLDYEDY